MTIIARLSTLLWTLVVLSLLPATFISADTIKDTAIYSTVEALQIQMKVSNNLAKRYIVELPTRKNSDQSDLHLLGGPTGPRPQIFP